MNARKKVVVLGGGVAGMSAAHELIERGFDVDVYERNNIAGGKARSMAVPDSATGNRKPLPGEHGFRFFPGFYKHIIDTMSRIPYEGRKKVSHNLVPARQLGLVRFGQAPVIFDSQVSWSLKGLQKSFDTLFRSSIDIPREESEFFALRLWQLMTSCTERRLAEYEQVGWWAFLEAESKSDNYQKYFARGLTRSLVAAKAETASTYTVGNILLQLFFDILDPTIDVDRLLDGPTNDVWINPWLAYLQSCGVVYHLNARVDSINCDRGLISSVTVEKDGQQEEVQGDYYVAALPVEVMAPLISEKMIKADPTLEYVRELGDQTQWMNGLQIYLKRDIKLGNAHLVFVDSKWALISVSQRQFWSDEFNDLSKFGDGEVRGIISLDISDWDTPGLLGRKAKDSTSEQICEEVWEELKAGFIQDGERILSDEDFHSYHLDPDIVFLNIPGGPKMMNTEPLLVNLVNTWGLRPEAHTRIPNLFLASDYVRTNTDLATMEGANEAARRAVNSIIDSSGSKARLCKIWPLHEPSLLGLWREKDRTRFAKGLPWKEEFSLTDFLTPHFWCHFVKFIYLRIRRRLRKFRLRI